MFVIATTANVFKSTHILKNSVRGLRDVALNRTVPTARGNVQDVNAFLKAIGRNTEQYAEKFETWDKLFTTSSGVMKHDLGIDTKSRKYILNWVEKYRQGIQPYEVPLPKPKSKKK
ncbi:IGR protein motif-domain-containing protein [Mycotypha africana]|uniref:IGR protein motif-domain-containing protein n=1 Tax=Mycotypha africana TaxID=64632 RepID=UPI0023011794|nr:IGR protein motif-domain-containing protein [Mycotypha africana]KAI8971719.1 IGR protein motif-domain-containing protein [Mycotypha africana]